ncbi:GFA family protein [Pyxidicoccus sp. 3LG]
MTTETQAQQTANNVKKYVGGCHCGTVRFEAELDLSTPVNRCNCTICSKVGGSTMNIKPNAFRLLAGAQSLGEYRVGGSANPNSRSFCKHCGIVCFGGGFVEELGGDFRAVSVNCLDDVDLTQLTYQYWDGLNDNWGAGPRPQPWPNRRS